MKRFAVLLGAFGVVWFSAFSSGTVEAYRPVEAEEFEAFPFVNPPSGVFEAIVTGCFPGEQVVFLNFGVSPIDVDAATCDTTTFEASVTFQAPADEGEYNLLAFLAAETSSNPDIPDRPNRFLNTTYIVDADVVAVTSADVVAATSGDGALGFSGGAGPTFTATAGTGDRWPDFVTSVGFYRTFLALLALLVGIFFVWMWRRRREDAVLAGGYAGSPMPPPEPNRPTLA